jgi:multidrug resistance efflux pump
MSDQSKYWKVSLLTVGAFLFVTACRSGSTAANTNANVETAVVDVTTAQAVIRSIPTYFEATGNLVGDAQTDVAPAVGGKIVQVNFDIGSYVTQGDVLLRLDDRDARIRLEQAEAQVQQSRSAVMQAEAQADQARAAVRQAQAQLGL